MLDRKSLEKYQKSFKEGESLMREGEDPSHIVILLQGEITIWKGPKVVARIKVAAGEKPLFFGTMAYFMDTKRTASIVALSDCRTVEIPCSSLDTVIRSSPELAINMLRQMSQDIDRTNQQITELAKKDDIQIGRLRKDISELTKLVSLVATDTKQWQIIKLADFAKTNYFSNDSLCKFDTVIMDEYLRKLVEGIKC